MLLYIIISVIYIIICSALVGIVKVKEIDHDRYVSSNLFDSIYAEFWDCVHELPIVMILTLICLTSLFWAIILGIIAVVFFAYGITLLSQYLYKKYNGVVDDEIF